MPFRCSEFWDDHVVMRVPLNCPLVALADVDARARGRIRLLSLAFSVIFATFVPVGVAADDEPPLFGADGYRITAYRGKTPESVGESAGITASQARDLQQGEAALMLDVNGSRHYDITENGEFITAEKHKSIPGAIWLPVVGWGYLEPWQRQYLDESLRKLTGNDFLKPVVVFCKVDCWLGWNAARRISEMGYQRIYWFPGGIDVWEDAEYPLEPISAFPLSRSLADQVFIGPSF